MTLSILIIDDDKAKRDLLIFELLDAGVLRADIQEGESAADCRRILGQRSFDLLLLDLVLPSRTGDHRASAVNGLELLRQVVVDKDLPAPRSIVGVTADESALSECNEEFRALTAQILLVRPADFNWKTSLRYLVDFLRNGKSRQHDFDICYITALRTPELDGVLGLPYGWSEEIAVGNGILVRRGSREIGGSLRRAICVHSNQMGSVASAFLTQFMLEKYRPRLVLMTGICGGVGSAPKLGDVVIADKSWDWQSGKWVNDGKFEAAPDQKEADPKLKALALMAGDWIPQFVSTYRGAKPKTLPSVHVGPMVSGSSVVTDPALHEKFKIQHRKSIAVDMECYGLYFAAAASEEPGTRVLCIKGVSDLANRAKGDHLQEFCSRLSAHIADQVVQRYFSV